MKVKFFLTSWFLLVTSILGFAFYWPKDSYLIACDVGQGDAILITSGFTQVLVDGGPDNKVLSCLSENMPFWDHTIELIVNTHPDADHYTGLKYVIERYNVEQFVSNNLVNPSGFFKEFRELVLEQKIPVYSPKDGDQLKIGDLKFEVLWPEEQVADYLVWEEKELPVNILGAKTKGFNNQSIVLLFQYGEFRALLAGDIDQITERKIISKHQFDSIDV